ncbi:MAG: hypothetical protein KDB03_13850 [Planctomycetales bacterium]|nr:hypothetical protein [Planctomycetales bacterium]
MHFYFLCLALALIQAVPTLSDPIAQYREAAKKWDKEIAALEALDQSQEDPEHVILFLGSSSIRLWEEIGDDLAPWPTIRRGYGGARFSDLAVYVDRLICNHQFDAAVLFVGNDISGSDQDKEPTEVLRLFDYVVSRVRVHSNSAQVMFIAITPTPSRFHVWSEIQKVNALIEQRCQEDDRLHFISTESEFLGPSGKPIDELFRADRLHLNRDGYAVWSKIIKAKFDQVLPTNHSSTASRNGSN